MKSLARGLVWWPGMDTSIETVVNHCSSCQQNRASPPHAPLQPWSWPTRPWSRLHVDYAGHVDGKMILIVVDAHSKWIEAIPLSTATAETTVQQLRVLFSILSVQAPGNNSFRQRTPIYCTGVSGVLLFQWHVNRTLSPFLEWVAERAVRIVKQGLKKLTTGTMLERLSRFIFQYRLTPQTTTGLAPANLLVGRRPRSRLNLLKPSLENHMGCHLSQK